MARSALSDILQSYCFWLSDVAPIEGFALPMLTPLYGFSAITAPEVTMDFAEITEGNWYFKKKIIKGANVSNMVLQRGATFYDSDFWRWTMSAISGEVKSTGFGPLKLGGTTPRRQLVLTQYMTRPSLNGVAGAIAAGIIGAGVGALGAGLSGGLGNVPFAGAGAIVGNGLGAATAAVTHALGFGPFEFQARIPAKAWILHGVLPARYKAASDFDATSSAVSIQELELSIEMIEEVALTA